MKECIRCRASPASIFSVRISRQKKSTEIFRFLFGHVWLIREGLVKTEQSFLALLLQ